MTLIRAASAVALVSALLYWEQTALLYILSTLAVCGLLVVVAVSDLEGRNKGLSESTSNERADVTGGEESATAPSPDWARRATQRTHQDAA